MAEHSSFFNSHEGDRRYTSAEFAAYFASFVGNGVYKGGDALQTFATNPSSMYVEVNIGAAFVKGYSYTNRDARKTLSIDPSHLTLTRVDTVVLRLDLSDNKRLIYAVIKKGENSSTPQPPPLQRDNAIWELGLAHIKVNSSATDVKQSDITDLRLNGNYCGIVTGLIDQPNLDTIFNQYYSKYNEVVNSWNGWYPKTQNDFKAFFDSIKANAEQYNSKNTNFEDWSRKTGFKKRIEFRSSSQIVETIQHQNNANSVIARKTTNFNADGSITEDLEFIEPAWRGQKKTVFSGNVVEEFYL